MINIDENRCQSESMLWLQGVRVGMFLPSPEDFFPGRRSNQGAQGQPERRDQVEHGSDL